MTEQHGRTPAATSTHKPRFGVSARLPEARDRDIETAASSKGTHPNFVYHGGPVINTPRVYMVFAGDWSGTPNQQRATRLSQFMKDLMNSRYMNILSQYGCGSTGTVVDSVFVGVPDNDLSDAQIHTILQTAISNNTLPEPTDPNNLYIVCLDDATGVHDKRIDVTMCEAGSDNAFGYHFFFKTAAGHNCVYAVIPGVNDTCLTETCSNDSTCSLHIAQTREQRQTQVMSHEFSEAISDPLLNAWTDDTPKGAGENGDICNGQSGTITLGANTWNVQRMYSKQHDMDTHGATTCLVETPGPLPSLLPHNPTPSRP